MAMRDKKGHLDLQGLHQEEEMKERIEEVGITVELIGTTEEMKSVGIGGRIETKTPSQDHLVKDHDHQVGALDLQQGDLAQELGLLLEEGPEPVLDTMCLYLRFL